MLLALGVGGDVADDLEQQRVVYLQCGLAVAWVKLLKAGIAANAVTCVGVLLGDVIVFRVIQLVKGAALARLDQSGVHAFFKAVIRSTDRAHSGGQAHGQHVLNGECVADGGIVAQRGVKGTFVFVIQHAEVGLHGGVVKIRAVQVVVGYVKAQHAARREVGHAAHLGAPNGCQQLHRCAAAVGGHVLVNGCTAKARIVAVVGSGETDLDHGQGSIALQMPDGVHDLLTNVVVCGVCHPAALQSLYQLGQVLRVCAVCDCAVKIFAAELLFAHHVISNAQGTLCLMHVCLDGNRAQRGINDLCPVVGVEVRVREIVPAERIVRVVLDGIFIA